MNKEEIKNFALKLLEGSELDSIDTIEVSENTYSDGSPYLEITVDYKENVAGDMEEISDGHGNDWMLVNE